MRRLWVLLVVVVALGFTGAPAWADEIDDLCADDPDCSVGSSMDTGLGIPGWFIAVMVPVVLVGIAATVYRVSAVRAMARKAGLDPDDATRVALLDEDGVSAAYLAAQLRGRPEGTAPETGAPRSSAERLRELQELRDQGLITEAEYAERRTAILDAL